MLIHNLGVVGCIYNRFARLGLGGFCQYILGQDPRYCFYKLRYQILLIEEHILVLLCLISFFCLVIFPLSW